MTPSQLYDLFRIDIVDVATPHLFSDEEVWEYMDEAHKQFARLIGGISDASSNVTQLDVRVGDVWADVDPRILKIRHAQKSTNNAELELINFEDTELLGRENDYGVRRMVRFDNSTGPLQYLVAGMERDKLRLLPIPDTDETVSLIVYRLPLVTLTAGDHECFEIEEQHHRFLLHWMKKLAYEKQDAETFDKNRAVEFEEKFLRYCRDARHERELREHKYRAVSYGGI